MHRLGVGTNGQVLAADSSQTDGLAWTTGGNGDVSTSSSATFGAHVYDFTASTVSLPSPWVSKAVANSYTPGAKQTFQTSSTTAGMNMPGATNPSAPAANDIWMSVSGGLRWYNGVSVIGIESGAGSPEGVVTAPVGFLYLRTDGGVSTTLYVKTSGTGNTGWTAK